MELTNMQLSKAEQKDLVAGPGNTDNAPRYPWGLSLNLDEESLEKLGITGDGDLPDVGAELVLTAKVKVTSVSSNEVDGDKTRQSVGLQICAMSLGPEGGKKKPHADVLYSEK